MSLRTKLLLAVSPLALALAVVGVSAVVVISALGTRSQQILRDNYRSVLAAQHMSEAIDRLQSQAAMSALGEVAPAAEDAAAMEIFERELRVEEGNITEPGEAAVAQALRAEWSSYQEARAQLTASSDADGARHVFRTSLQPSFERVRRFITEMRDLNQYAIVRKSDAAKVHAERMNTIIATVALFAFLIGLAIVLPTADRVLRPLAALGVSARRIGEGHFDTRAPAQGGDELAQLGRDFNAMAERLREYRSSSLGELLQTQQSAQAAIDSLPDPVVVFTASGEVRQLNSAAETILGLAIESKKGATAAVQDLALREVVERVSAHVLGGNGPYQPRGFNDAVKFTTADGDHYFLPRAAPVYEERGTVGGVTVVFQDVTRLRRFDELKNDLVATVAHEFRTPLTSLRMAIHLCIEGAVGAFTERQSDLLYAAREDCERLQGLIDDLLDLSRLEAGRVEMRPHDLPAAELLARAVGAHRQSAEEHGIRLEVAPIPIELTAYADPDRVSVVLANLLNNAIQYTPRGGVISVRARTVDDSLRIDIADNGPGVPPDFRRRIFDKFVRVPGTPAGGAGLGLSIVKEIVEAHGGNVGVDSRPEGGSVFWFTLPRARGATV